MGSDKEHGGLLDTINMEKVRIILTHTYPYPHEHSRHAIIAVVIGCLFFISSDNMHTLIQKLDNNIKWWSMYACLLGFFYFFSSPFVGKTIKPSYSNFSRWYIAWILVAAVYHLPSFQSMGVDMRMNLSLFLTIYISSIFVLLVFHLIFLGLWYVGLVSRVAGRRPEILTIIQNCAVLSVACCVFYSHCGNHALNEKRLGRRDSSLFSLWKKGETSIWLSKFLKMYELKDEICKSWFAPVGSAGDYPLLSKWVIYGEFSCSGPCESSDEISPMYSLWATFIGLYMANYVVERSTGYPNPSAFTYEKRLFRPFEYALQPPSWYKDVHIAVDKPELPSVQILRRVDKGKGKNVTHLVKDYLKGRCKLRMAGDLHHYLRHSRVPSENPDSVQHLLVNGCGGAFLHPTHVFSNFDKAYGTNYEIKAAYPSFEDSSRIALGNILKFRKKNWQFDIIGGFIYFILTFSMFPQVITRYMNGTDGWKVSIFRTPQEWKLDPDWDNEVKQPQQASHHRKFPSKWKANAFHQDPVNTVRVVDHFVIQPTDKLQVAAVNGSMS
ncbi:hypothetical protein Ccrd_022334 [Cynara cardunculus var. scolymus]|uniref:Uncharacterized protein n=1 Tax=Cynara cardunculus var. scolymus TaxID=59895 RepID=A0A124SE99_CYNCS|nr:hypothetical protein Ccrd_022334 [Cynara cardunculus var. scolymus]